MKRIALVTLISFLIPVLSHAGQWRMRAREHFDIHQVKQNGQSESYQGFSNSFHIGLEKPFHYFYGLSFNPLFGSASKDQSQLQELGNKIRLMHIGGEVKYFLFFKHLFGRVGLGWTQLRSTSSIKYSNGYNGYLGLGWEFKVNKIGLAVEGAYRYSNLQNHTKVISFTPSLGVHFYDLW